MYVYISEGSNSIRNFTNAQLVWKQEGLVYGDWYGGPNLDGTYSHSTEVRLSKVRRFLVLLQHYQGSVVLLCYLRFMLLSWSRVSLLALKCQPLRFPILNLKANLVHPFAKLSAGGFSIWTLMS